VGNPAHLILTASRTPYNNTMGENSLEISLIGEANWNF